MKINKIRIFFNGFIFIISTFFISVGQTFALEVETHKTINFYIANENSSINGFSLDNYLKNNLGMTEGVKATFKSQMVKELISDGGEYEDEPPGCAPYWRSRNHFHNPIDKSGFSDWWDTGIFSGMSAVDWINQPPNTQSCGFYSWNDARDYYYKALTSSDKATREANFADAFIKET
jgi:hypothetical protein